MHALIIVSKMRDERKKNSKKGGSKHDQIVSV